MTPRKRAVVQRVIDSYNGVPCTFVRPDDAPNRPGEVCGEIHDRCIGHRKASADEREERRGDPCQKPARQGLLVCASHGGSTQTARAKGAAVMAKEAAAAAVNKRLGHGDATGAAQELRRHLSTTRAALHLVLTGPARSEAD